MAEELVGKARGAQARADKLSPGRRQEIARKAALTRWDGSIPKATHVGNLKIGPIDLPCAVLEDGRRVLTQEGFLKAIGRAAKAKGGQGVRTAVDGMPPFLVANNLKPFIHTDLLDSTKAIAFRGVKGGQTFGYPAELLPRICQVYLDARDKKVLLAGQEHIARQCDVLIRGLAQVGIVGLIDEATGYQEVRDRLALQAILDKYLLKEFAAWAKRFPDEFYREMFRLKDWQGTWKKRPNVVGSYTNDLVYDRLAPGILEELQDRNPKDNRGYRKTKHHQWLTEDIGHPALTQHLHAILGLMRASNNWGEFYRMIERAFPKKKQEIEIFGLTKGPALHR